MKDNAYELSCALLRKRNTQIAALKADVHELESSLEAATAHKDTPQPEAAYAVPLRMSYRDAEKAKTDYEYKHDTGDADQDFCDAVNEWLEAKGACTLRDRKPITREVVNRALAYVCAPYTAGQVDTIMELLEGGAA